MKKGLTSVDVAALAVELASLLVGARMEKAYQPAKDRILLRLRQKGAGKLDFLVQVGVFATVTRRSVENPDKPSMVAQILRSELENARLIRLKQVGFDRILRLDFERGDGKRSLVFELFGDGNMLLLDEAGTIVLPMRGADHGARSLRKGEAYQPPPGPPSPLTRPADELHAAWVESGRDLVRYLAGVAGFGPQWAEEIVHRAGVPKNAKPGSPSDATWTALMAQIQQLAKDIERNDLAPGLLVDDQGAPVDAVPFKLESDSRPMEESPSFREALDALFVGGPDADGEEPDDPRRPKFEAARGKLLNQVRQIDDAIHKFEEEDQAFQREGECLYHHFAHVESTLKFLSDAREKLGWNGLESKLHELRAQGNPAALAIPTVHPHEGTVILRLDDAGTPRDVLVDLRLSVQENAQSRFEAAKKARSRKEGALVALKDARGRVAELEARGLDAFGAAPTKADRTSRHFWFESYRWTITPHGFVAVGGRNAGQNDAVVKKYLREGDRYVHAEIHGAPSIVVRRAEGPPEETPPEDLRAACHFSVIASRAWRQFGAASAYWVSASQVSKTPRSGEFVPKGAWMVHGKRNVETDLPMEWFVARVRFASSGAPLKRGETAPREFVKLVGASRESLAPYVETALRLVPGDMEPQDAATDLSTRFEVTQEEAAAVIPAGPVRIENEVAL